MFQHTFGHATHEPTLQPASPVRGKHDQIAWWMQGDTFPTLCHLDERIRHISTLLHGPGDVHLCIWHLMEETVTYSLEILATLVQCRLSDIRIDACMLVHHLF